MYIYIYIHIYIHIFIYIHTYSMYMTGRALSPGLLLRGGQAMVGLRGGYIILLIVCCILLYINYYILYMNYYILTIIYYILTIILYIYIYMLLIFLNIVTFVARIPLTCDDLESASLQKTTIYLSIYLSLSIYIYIYYFSVAHTCIRSVLMISFRTISN